MPAAPPRAGDGLPEAGSRLAGWSWSLASFAIALAATIALYLTRGWHWLGVPPISTARPPFSDAHAQLMGADACLAGAGEWVRGVCFLPSMDVLPHSQAYPPWLLFSRLGMTHEHYLVVGWIAVLAFYACVIALFRPRSWRAAALLLALLFSPAAQLAVERANFDLFIASLLIVAGGLLARAKPRSEVLACAALGLATMLKLYTGLAAFGAWLAAAAGQRRRVALLGAIAGIAAIALVGPHNVLVLGAGAPEGATRFSTGAHLTFAHYGTPGGLGVVAAALALCALVLQPWQGRTRAMPPVLAKREAAVFVLAWLTAIPLFLLKDSYDYRLVLWLPMLALAVVLASRNEADRRLRRAGKVLVAAFLFVSFAELACRTVEHGLGSGARFIVPTLVATRHVAIWLVALLSTSLLPVACMIAGRRAAA